MRRPRSVPGTVVRLTEMASDKGLQFVAVIDESEQARRVGLERRSATLVMSV
jgi:hypothetical protein